MKKFFLMFMGIITAILMLSNISIYAADNQEKESTPTVVDAKLINEYDMELYWSEEMTSGAGNSPSSDISNFSVTVDGKSVPIYQYTWWEYQYSEYGIVYYNQKTSIRLEQPISDVNHLPELQVSVKANKVKGSSGKYASEQSVTVDTYDPFYQKEITLDCGVKILGTKNVKDEAMTKAKEMMQVLLLNESLAKRMGDAGCKLGIYGEGEIAYDIPEHRYSYDENYLYVEGFGGTQLASVKDANVLRITYQENPSYYTNYEDESIVMHEFGHTVQNYGLTQAQKQQWEQIYQKSVTQNGKWPGSNPGELSYAGSNSSEYFATLTAIWFEAMNDTWDGKWDGVRGPINTRKELKAYDKDAYDFLATIYSADSYLPNPWEKGSVPDHHTYINFDANGGNDVDETRIIANGEAIGTLPVTSKSGYVFQGWYTDSENGTEVTASTKVSELDTSTFYAHWEEENKGGDDDKDEEKPQKVILKKGDKITVKGVVYQVTNAKAKEVTALKPQSKKAKTITLCDTVKIKKTTCKVVAVSKGSFSGMKNLTKVTISKNVKTIGYKAFYHDAKLKSVIIKGSSVKAIGKYSFQGIAKKATIDVPNKKRTSYKKMLKNAKTSSTVKIQ